MPRIRAYEEQIGAKGSIPSAGASGASFGVGVQNAVAEFGATLERIGGHFEKVRRQTVLASATAGASQELQEFAFTLENGTVQEDGTVVPPPDPSEHLKLYNQKSTEIRDRAKAALGDNADYSLFEQDFNKAVLKESFGVRRNVIEKQKAFALGDFDRAEDALADVAARGDAFTQSSAIEQYRGMLEGMVRAGAIDAGKAPEREKKFRVMVERAGVREAIRQDPDAAIIGLMDSEKFPYMQPDERQKWIDTAGRESERRVRVSVASDERSRRDAERMEKTRNEATFKTATDLAVSGKLTVGWVQMNRDNIAKDDYAPLLKLAAKGGSLVEGEGNREVYADLRVRAGRGEDVRGAAKSALLTGQISTEKFSNLMGEVEANSAVASAENWYKSARGHISTALAPSMVNPRIDNEVLARALDDWQRYASGDGQKATPAERQRVRDSIVDSSRIIRSEELLTSIPAPKFLSGTKTSFMSMDKAGAQAEIKQAYKRTKEAFEAGQISRFEYEREARNIQLLDRWAESHEPVAQTKGR